MSNERKLHGSPLVRFLFLVYAALMIWLLFLQRIDKSIVAEENWNFIPFATLKIYWKLLISENPLYVGQAVINLAGNVVMFVPLGAFLPAIWLGSRKFLSLAVTSAGLIILIEALQYITGLGSCDVDDVILNLPGIFIGYLVWKMWFRKH